MHRFTLQAGTSCLVRCPSDPDWRLHLARRRQTFTPDDGPMEAGPPWPAALTFLRDRWVLCVRTDQLVITG